MKNQNNSLKSNNLFSKVKAWLYNMFKRSQKNRTNFENTDQVNATTVNEIKVNNKPKNYFEECKEKNERRQYLLNLQTKYKNKEILEENMNEEDRTDLENIYMEQNMELKRKIRALDSEIANAKK